MSSLRELLSDGLILYHLKCGQLYINLHLKSYSTDQFKIVKNMNYWHNPYERLPKVHVTHCPVYAPAVLRSTRFCLVFWVRCQLLASHAKSRAVTVEEWLQEPKAEQIYLKKPKYLSGYQRTYSSIWAVKFSPVTSMSHCCHARVVSDYHMSSTVTVNIQGASSFMQKRRYTTIP